MGRDTIADIIASIRNADMDKKGGVRIGYANIAENIIKILLREGFIENVRKHRESNKYFLVSTLRHRRNRKRPYKTILKRISRPGLRIYSNYQRIPRILGGMGVVIISTSRGERSRGSIRRNLRINFVLYMVILLVSELDP